MSVDAPTKSDSVPLQVDWLELVAMFSNRQVARLDEILASFEIGEDSAQSNTAIEDAEEEDIYSLLADEVSRRETVLGIDAYPFIMSPNGEQLSLKANLSYGHKAYLASLIHYHNRGSGKLSGAYRLTDTEAAQGRNKFEIFAVFAAHGLCDGGHTFYVGSNRSGQESLLEIINHACVLVGEGIADVVCNLPPDAPEAVNDGGVDVISVHEEMDGAPARCWYFGQIAAGENFPAKSAKAVVDNFAGIWFSTPPANVAGLMLIASNPDDQKIRFHTRTLGHILHRMRLPKYTQRGKNFYDNDNSKVHYVEDPNIPCNWLQAYVTRVRAL